VNYKVSRLKLEFVCT